MTLTPKQMVKLLEQSGFVLVRQRGSHILFVNSKTGKMTVVPMHGKDLKPGLESRILKDAGLKKFKEYL